MRISPDGANLLETVRNVLRDEILPALPRDRHYTLHMALNALGIAQRQLMAGEAAEAEECAALAALLGEQGTPEHLQRTLAQRARAGDLDDAPALQALLWHQALQRARESAPRYLQQEGVGA